MNRKKSILVIIQRSNGDVYYSLSLIKILKTYYQDSYIDILVNDDTYSTAAFSKEIRKIISFSYNEKQKRGLRYLLDISKLIFRKYDLSISLTSSDRSILFAIISAKKSIGMIEKEKSKSWWKRFLLTNFFFYDTNTHAFIQTHTPLDILGIKYTREFAKDALLENIPEEKRINEKLKKLNIEKFIIFHPSAQYEYKVYPEKQRLKLLEYLNQFGIPIIITGGKTHIDLTIKSSLPKSKNLYDFIGETTLSEFFYLSKQSIGFIGMDTLNIHIAASQNKRIFGIYGPTIVKKWSPWSNKSKAVEKFDRITSYENITIFQGGFSCVPCGKKGCNDCGISDCFNDIDPKVIKLEIKKWIYENY